MGAGGGITACSGEISHTALVGRVRARIGDKRVLALVKAFLKAGILTGAGTARETITGTPQGGILSPLLASHHALPPPGNDDPLAMAQRDLRKPASNTPPEADGQRTGSA